MAPSRKRRRYEPGQGIGRKHANVFVGEDSIRFFDGLDARLGDESRITIVPVVSGG